MSRARMAKRRPKVAAAKYQRHLARRSKFCLMVHWKALLASQTFDPWRHPWDQDVRVAWLTVRCRDHHNYLSVPAVISHEEECAAEGSGGLLRLIENRLKGAYALIVRMVVPRDRRREFA